MNLSRRSTLKAATALAGAALLPGCAEEVTTKDGKYAPTIASLTRHQAPEWFRDAKFGVFIHWGLYSIPAFAPHRSTVPQDIDPLSADQFKYNAYAEWYQNSLAFEDSPTAAYHRQHYGNQPYATFADTFNAMLEDWDPQAWARSIARSGARYLVLVTKHHDGFTLWPSTIKHPNVDAWHTRRDVVGELGEAVRAEGMKFGVYYSGGIDWSFKHRRIESFLDLMLSMPSPGTGYPEYVDAHYRELIQRYRPDYLWNDISYPSEKAALGIAADYYNAVPDGLINDRWIALRGLLRPSAWRRPEGITGLLPPAPPVYDVRTPEYAMFDRMLPFDWESTRGIGHSFGYNAQETEADLLPTEDIIRMLTQAACYNGNVLLNIGPRGDGTLDPAQMQRLHAVGNWLGANGSALQDTRALPWPQAEVGGVRIGATRTTSRAHLHLLGTPPGDAGSVTLPEGLQVTAATVRGSGHALPVAERSLVLRGAEWPAGPTQIIDLALGGDTANEISRLTGTA